MCEIADAMASAPATSLYEALMAVKPDDLTPNAWAVRAGVNRNVFNDVRRRGTLKTDILQKLLGAVDVSFAQFDAGLHPVKTEVAGTGVSGAADVRREFFGEKPAQMPLLGTATGGEYGDIDEDIELTELHLGEVLDYLAKPLSLARDKDAYALTIVGDSMAPRFKPGERVAVSPLASIAIGDDVIVQLRGMDGEDERVKMVLIKELVRRSASTVTLRQHNPARDFTVARGRVVSMHKVQGHFL